MTRTALAGVLAVWVLTLAAAGPAGEPAHEPQDGAFALAITVDDLPWTAGGSLPRVVVADGTTRMLEALRSRNVQAAGFIVCDAMGAHPGQVERWGRARHNLGNHSQSHRDVNATPIPRWLDDVRRCHDTIRGLEAFSAFFRYPFLHRGSDLKTREAAAHGIAALGYAVAPVTIDNSEWIVASAYEQAARRAAGPSQRQLADLYLDHMRRATDHAREVSRTRFGREVRQILLLHANRLNADWLGTVLDALAARGARFVTLQAALEDPVYALEDGYVGRSGLSWLYRAAPARPDFAQWDEAEEARVQQQVDQILGAFRP